MIAARNLRVEVGGACLLDGVSFELRAGEVAAIVGANGAGKSTLLKTLCQEVTPSRGEVKINNRALNDWSHGELARVRAVLPQDSILNFPFTVLEVALLGRTPHARGGESALDYEIARRALEATDALHLAARLYPSLSGGERQRVQLARVLAQIWDAPKTGDRFLLLDEPTSSLDLAHGHSTLAVARRFAREGVGALVVLHDLNLAAQYADRIIVLKGGRVLATGAPAEVLTPEIIAEAYGVRVLVLSHPQIQACPLIVPLAASDAPLRMEQAIA